MKPGEEKDLRPIDPENKPIKEIEIKVKPKDPRKNITMDTVPKLKVCAHPSKF